MRQGDGEMTPRELLAKYGQHLDDCNRWLCWHTEHTPECCTCGFDAALASHAPSDKLTAHEFEVLWSAVSKLESQVLRNPELPQYYKSVCANAFEILRHLRNGASSEAVAQPKEYPGEFMTRAEIEHNDH